MKAVNSSEALVIIFSGITRQVYSPLGLPFDLTIGCDPDVFDWHVLVVVRMREALNVK